MMRSISFFVLSGLFLALLSINSHASKLWRHGGISGSGRVTPAGEYLFSSPKAAAETVGKTHYTDLENTSYRFYYSHVDNVSCTSANYCSASIKYEQCMKIYNMSPATKDLWRSEAYTTYGVTSQATEYFVSDGMEAVRYQAENHFDGLVISNYEYDFIDFRLASCGSTGCYGYPNVEKCNTTDGYSSGTRHLWRYIPVGPFLTNPNNIKSDFTFGSGVNAVDAQGSAIYNYEDSSFTYEYLYYHDEEYSVESLIDGDWVNVRAKARVNRCGKVNGNCVEVNYQLHAVRGVCDLIQYFPAIRSRLGTCPVYSKTAYLYPIDNKMLGCQSENKTLTANPIHIAIGNKYQQETDYEDQSVSPLSFTRYYNSQDDAQSTIGNSWRHSFSRRLASISTLKVNMERDDGSLIEFTKSGGVWNAEPDETGDISHINNQWVYENKGVMEIYDNDGLLVEITNSNGQIINLAYTNGLLGSVTNHFGRSLTLAYNDDLQVISVTLPDSNVLGYEYSESNNLSAVVFPDETVSNPLDNPKRIYHYENANFPTYLTGITDENGRRYASWSYDEYGRAITSEHTNGIDSYTVERIDPLNEVRVTDPLGQTRTYSFGFFNNKIKITGLDGGACTQCGGAVASSYTYNAEGLVDSKTDQNGVTTTYTYDVEGREISRTEAYSTPEERIITTQWHATLDKPLVISEPNRTTTYSYDVQGRLISTNVQDTVQ